MFGVEEGAEPAVQSGGDFLLFNVDVARMLGDLLSTKLKVIGDRGELRGHFDLLVLEAAGHRIEEGLACWSSVIGRPRRKQWCYTSYGASALPQMSPTTPPCR